MKKWRRSSQHIEEYKDDAPTANRGSPFKSPTFCFGITLCENLNVKEFKPDYMVYTNKKNGAGRTPENSKWLIARYHPNLTLKKMISTTIDESMTRMIVRWINNTAKNMNIPPGIIYAI